MKDTINKKDLTSGMVVRLNNGYYCHVFTDVHFFCPGEDAGSIESVIVCCNMKESIVLSSYDENLKIREKDCCGLDIMEVWAPTTFSSLRRSADVLRDHHMIWKRKPDPKPMTIEEIEKELGYPITIIK